MTIMERSEGKMKKRPYIWQHNALLGNVGIIRVYLNRIKRAESASPYALRKVEEIERLLERLDEELRSVRIEPDGTRKLLKGKKDD